MKNLILRLVHQTEGQDLIEYTLLGSLIGMTVTTSMIVIANGIIMHFGAISDKIHPPS